MLSHLTRHLNASSCWLDEEKETPYVRNSRIDPTIFCSSKSSTRRVALPVAMAIRRITADMASFLRCRAAAFVHALEDARALKLCSGFRS